MHDISNIKRVYFKFLNNEEEAKVFARDTGF
jgi:hypothetical protein